MRNLFFFIRTGSKSIWWIDKYNSNKVFALPLPSYPSQYIFLLIKMLKTIPLAVLYPNHDIFLSFGIYYIEFLETNDDDRMIIMKCHIIVNDIIKNTNKK